jgi:WD40 repeat protein
VVLRCRPGILTSSRVRRTRCVSAVPVPAFSSCGTDLPSLSSLSQMVKCWDLETNKVIRHYHGHLSGVYSLAYASFTSSSQTRKLTFSFFSSLHPTLDVLVTAGRDASARVRLSLDPFPPSLVQHEADSFPWIGLGHANKIASPHPRWSHRYHLGRQVSGE